MPGSLYGTYTPTDVLGIMVNRHVEKQIGKTATYAPIALNLMEREASSKGITGSYLSWAVEAGDPARAQNFEVYGTNDGQTAVEPDNFIECQAKNKYTVESIKISEIKLAEAGGFEAQLNYATEMADTGLLSLNQKLNRNFYYADPTVSSPDPFGMKFTINYTSTYGGATRSNSRGLVGWRLDSAKVTTNVAAATTGNSTVTGGSTSVTTTGAFSCDAGDIVTITTGSGSSAVTRRYLAAAAVSATTALTITPQLDYAQLADGVSSTTATVTVQAPFYAASTGFGAANEFHLGKVNRAFALAKDGSDSPDIMLCDSFLYQKFLDESLAMESHTMVDQQNGMGALEGTGFRYHTSTVYADNNINPGELFGLTTKYIGMRGTQKFLKRGLHRGLQPEVAITPNSVANMIGRYIVSRNHICWGINRQFLILNMTA